MRRASCCSEQAHPKLGQVSMVHRYTTSPAATAPIIPQQAWRHGPLLQHLSAQLSHHLRLGLRN